MRVYVLFYVYQPYSFLTICSYFTIFCLPFLSFCSRIYITSTTFMRLAAIRVASPAMFGPFGICSKHYASFRHFCSEFCCLGFSSSSCSTCNPKMLDMRLTSSPTLFCSFKGKRLQCLHSVAAAGISPHEVDPRFCNTKRSSSK